MRTLLVAVVFLTVQLSPEVLGAPKKAEPISANSSLGLTVAQRDELISEANSGNNNAAARLGMFYDFVTKDRESAYYWFTKAALNGHVMSQYNLGVRSLGKRSFESCTEAKYWFDLASKNGMEKAQRALDEVGDCAKLPHQDSNG